MTTDLPTKACALMNVLVALFNTSHVNRHSLQRGQTASFAVSKKNTA